MFISYIVYIKNSFLTSDHQSYIVHIQKCLFTFTLKNVYLLHSCWATKSAQGRMRRASKEGKVPARQGKNRSRRKQMNRRRKIKHARGGERKEWRKGGKEAQSKGSYDMIATKREAHP